MNPLRFATLFVLTIAGVASLWEVSGAEERTEPLDYVRDIKPILSRHCTECHGRDLAESGLRLDRVGLAVAGGDRGPAVVPGSSEESLLYQAIAGEGDLESMPFEQPPLPLEHIALIRRWIDSGARAPESEYEGPRERQQSDHWSFQPIRRVAAPSVGDLTRLRNPIDAFVLARLERAGLAPSPPADRPVLIRRLTLDLLGLLPSSDDVDAFVADERPGAYERLVDKLLSSPHYGERWGRHWLDVARYADSNGFTIDGPRSIWKYRDWVVDAINDDLPFDQFIVEQLAGDLLPNPKRDQIIATGFHRNTLVNEEGGTDDEQFRVDAVVDRVNTTGIAFLGLTVGCAQCHQHKYDPISQREFYQLFAFFNNTEDVNTVGPELPLPSAEQAERQAELGQEVSLAQAALKEYDARIAAGQGDWERQVVARADIKWTVLDPVEFVSRAGATIDRRDDRSLIVGGNGNIPGTDTYVITANVALNRVSALRLEVLADAALPNHGPGLADDGNFVLTEFQASMVPLNAVGGPAGSQQQIEWHTCVADWSQDGFSAVQSIDGDPNTGWSIGVKENEGSLNVDREAIFLPQETSAHPDGVQLTIQIKQSHGKAKHLLGRFRLSATADPTDSIVPESVRRFAAVKDDERTLEQQVALRSAYVRTDTGRQNLADRVNELTRQQSELSQAIPSTLVLRERAEPRETHVMLRGDSLRPGAEVKPDVPAVLPPLREGLASPSRLDLARWLVAADNPLTARVSVNRHWQHFFGLGLVETENDFGLQGVPPSHPDLLDWLAGEFQRMGWSAKRLHRLIVTSATYRQSSRTNDELRQRDQANKLLARQSRLRLEAEAVRDVWLVASGLLSPTIGGAGVYPPQPGGINLLTQVSKSWPESQGGERYRRGMYTYFWRSNPYPLLPTFDAPNATASCTRRSRSNTPLQALTLANDRSFVEIAKALASRILRQDIKTDEARLSFAFRTCLAREPNEYEQARLVEFLQRQRESFGRDGEEALAIVPADLPAHSDVATAAAWTAVARVLLNLDEFITRE